MASIYLYSENNGRCVELKFSKVQPGELLQLQSFLPSKIKGLSFNQAPAQLGCKILQYNIENRGPVVAKYLSELGEKLLTLGQPLGALYFFDFSNREEKSPYTPLWKARALVALGRMEEALKEVNAFNEFKPHDGLAYFLLARIYLNRDDYQKAETYFEKSIQLLKEKSTDYKICKLYQSFNQLFIDRDSLYSRNLSTNEYLLEIKQLKKQIAALKAEVLAFKHSEVLGMQAYLDSFDKLLDRWVDELTRNQTDSKVAKTTQRLFAQS